MSVFVIMHRCCALPFDLSQSRLAPGSIVFMKFSGKTCWLSKVLRIHILKTIFEELLKVMHPKVLMEKVEILHRLYSQQCWKCLSQMKGKTRNEMFIGEGVFSFRF